MTKSPSLLLSLLAVVLLLSVPSLSRADNIPPLTSPETAKKFNEFRSKAGMDFLLPQVFKNHPGVTFILIHAKELSLTDKQVKKLRKIRRHMIDRSLSQMKKIESLRENYLKMANMPDASAAKIHKDLHAIAWLMAQATADHLAGHLKAADVLTKTQREKLASIK